MTPDQPTTTAACTPAKSTACAQGAIPWRCGGPSGTLSGCAFDASESTRSALLYNCKAVGELELPSKDYCDTMPPKAAMAVLAPAGDTQLAGLGPPPDPPDNNPMGGLGPPADPQKQNLPPGPTAAAPPQGPIFIPVPVAPPNVCNPPPPPNVCHSKPPPNVCHQKPPSSGTNSGTNPGTGTKIVDTWDTKPKPGDTPKPGDGSTGVINSGSCSLPDPKTGVKTFTDAQGRKCTTTAKEHCNPSEQTTQTPPPPSGPLMLKPKPATQLASAGDPKTDTPSVPACESKAPYLPWGGTGSATITVSGGKPCAVGWHDTGATILDSMSVTSHPAHGSLTPKDQHVIIFTPTPGYKGKDSFMLSMREHNRGRRATLRVKVNVTIQ